VAFQRSDSVGLWGVILKRGLYENVNGNIPLVISDPFTKARANFRGLTQSKICLKIACMPKGWNVQIVWASKVWLANFKSIMRTILNSLLVAAALFSGIHQVAAQTTLFTYQGSLQDGGNAANGTNYGMVFYLYDASTNGNLLGNEGIVSVTVSDGLFTVPLDFGSQFDGNPRWLEIQVQKNGGGFTTLSPRQQVTPTPYAIFATTASNVSGTISVSQIPAVVLTNGATGVNLNGTFNGTFSGDGSGLANTVTTGNYVSAYDTTTHAVSVPNTFQNISFNATSTGGWVYFGGGSDSFTCNQAGEYLIQYDAEVETASAGAATFSLRVYNSIPGEIPSSESSVILSTANQPAMISKSFLTYCTVGNLLQFQFACSSTQGKLVAGVGVATYQPSISCTIIRIQ
jgi:hypothetical protein